LLSTSAKKRGDVQRHQQSGQQKFSRSYFHKIQGSRLVNRINVGIFSEELINVITASGKNEITFFQLQTQGGVAEIAKFRQAQPGRVPEIFDANNCSLRFKNSLRPRFTRR
jgi:hypothetical protein